MSLTRVIRRRLEALERRAMTPERRMAVAAALVAAVRAMDVATCVFLPDEEYASLHDELFARAEVVA